MLEDSIAKAKKTDKLRINCKECDEYELYSANTLKNALNGWTNKGLEYYQTCKACRRGTQKLYCQECNKSFRRTKSDIGPNVYCSRKCAAKANNRKFPKRTSTRACQEKTCLNKPHKSSKWCLAHKPLNPYKDIYQHMSLGEFKARFKTDAAAYNHLRDYARKIYYSSDRKQSCNVVDCSYTNSFHVCHVRGLADHPDDVLVKDANDISNLVGLCPNHHWDWDHKLLETIIW